MLFASSVILSLLTWLKKISCQQVDFCSGSAIQPVSLLSYKEDTVKADFGPAFRGCMPATWGAVRSCCISTVKYEEKVFLKINLTGKSMKVFFFFFYETLNHSHAWSQEFMQFLFYHRKIFSNCGHSSYFNSFREGLLTP